MGILKNILYLILVSGVSSILVFPVQACDKPELSTGQTLYIPAYSHIYSANNERPFFLTVTLSIRNIDQHKSITITKVNYYETRGKLITRYLDSAIVLQPLESVRYVVPEKDESGGSGANFIAEWESEKCVNPPILESIMIGTRGGQGVSFTSRGQVIVDSDTE